MRYSEFYLAQGDTMDKVGLLAGIGNLPVEFMRAAHQDGKEVVVIAVVKDVSPILKDEADVYYEINVAKLNKIIKTLLKNDVTKVTMIGKVTKEILFKGLKFPDLRALKLLNRLRNRKDDTIMLAIVNELEKDGIEVVDQTLYLKHLMPPVGVYTKRKPDEGEKEDIRFGFETAKAMGGMDIGQTSSLSIKQSWLLKRLKVPMLVSVVAGNWAAVMLSSSKLQNPDRISVLTFQPWAYRRFKA